jgi:hypothetical protein
MRARQTLPAATTVGWQVFETLAPVLLAGVTEFRFSETFRLVEGVDAADYR